MPVFTILWLIAFVFIVLPIGLVLGCTVGAMCLVAVVVTGVVFILDIFFGVTA
jgi:hypothetical protein